MSDNVPTTDANPGPSPAERPLLRKTATEGKPPFNEVSVLFPLLTFYTVVYLGLIARGIHPAVRADAGR